MYEHLKAQITISQLSYVAFIEGFIWNLSIHRILILLLYSLKTNTPIFFFQKALRTILSYIPCREDKQKSRLEADIKPVVDAIIIKCTDGNRFDYPSWWMWKRNDYFIFEKSQCWSSSLFIFLFHRRTSQLSLSTLVELAKGSSGELSVGSQITGNHGSRIETSCIGWMKICFFLSRE